MPSDSYKGPHAFFTDEELKLIHRYMVNVAGNTPERFSIIEKIERVFESDPKWRQPPP